MSGIETQAGVGVGGQVEQGQDPLLQGTQRGDLARCAGEARPRGLQPAAVRRPMRGRGPPTPAAPARPPPLRRPPAPPPASAASPTAPPARRPQSRPAPPPRPPDAAGSPAPPLPCAPA